MAGAFLYLFEGLLVCAALIAAPFLYYGWRERQLDKRISETHDPNVAAAEVDVQIAKMKAEAEMMKRTRGRW